MNDFLEYAGALLIGSIPVGFLLMKKFKGLDLAKDQGGYSGITNVWKVAGPFWGLLTLALDILKGATAVSLAHFLSPTDQSDWILAGFLVLLADEFPIFLKFRGGRGIGVAMGVFGSLLFFFMGK